MTCPDDLALVALHDGELSENQASTIRKHVTECASCRARLASIESIAADLAAPLPSALRMPPEAFADGVLARIDQRRERPTSRARWLVVAAAAALLLGVGIRSQVDRRDEWSARGGGSTTPVQRTQLRFGRVAGTAFEPIERGAHVAADATLAVEIAGTDRSTFLLAFLLDSAGDRHWLYPSYTDETPHPLSVSVPQGTTPHVLDSMVRPDHPAPGHAHLIAIVLPKVESIDFVESEDASALTREQLASHYPGSLVVSLEVEIP
jgi:hypothetical protein